MQKMHDLMSDNGVIMNIPNRDKSHLERRDTIIKVRLKSLSKNLGDSFVNGIAKADGSVVSQFTGILTLGNKSYEGGIKIFEHVTSFEEALQCLHQGIGGFQKFL